MALPASGQITMDNMNTDRAVPSGTQIDLDTAAIAYGIPTKPHGMDEFYGKSVGVPTPAPSPTPAPTPAPTPTAYSLSMTLNVGCFGYAGSGYIDIVSVSGGSGN